MPGTPRPVSSISCPHLPVQVPTTFRHSSEASYCPRIAGLGPTALSSHNPQFSRNATIDAQHQLPGQEMAWTGPSTGPFSWIPIRSSGLVIHTLAMGPTTSLHRESYHHFDFFPSQCPPPPRLQPGHMDPGPLSNFRSKLVFLLACLLKGEQIQRLCSLLAQLPFLEHVITSTPGFSNHSSHPHSPLDHPCCPPLSSQQPDS